MGKKQFCFFQTAETENRTPDSGVKGSGANHYPRAPALLGQNPICLGYNQETRGQVQIYFRRVFLPPPSPVLVSIHSILVLCRDDAGLPTKFRFNVWPALQPFAGSCRSIVYDAGLTLPVRCILYANM